MYELRISLAPSGDLRLHLPSRIARAIDFPPSVAGLKLIQQTLRNADSGLRDQPGHIREFPTQAVVEAWKKADDTARREATREAYAEQGIDLGKLELEL